MGITLIFPLAYLLDLVFGDPVWPGHPVRLIGWLIASLEKRMILWKVNKILSGLMLVVLVVGITAVSIYSILKLAGFIHIYLYYFVSVLFIYFSLSAKQLGVEANKVYSALETEDLAGGRKALSMIVARDTDNLDEPQVIRATVETVAESTMDGVVAPLCYAFLGGPVLAWVYKAINTLDSMVGYRNEKYINFGKVSASLDALVNFIPAKITCFLIALSAFFCGKDGLRALKWAAEYIFKGPKSNSEATEAAMAGALKVQLGGLNFYNTAPILKTHIGDNLYPLDKKHIRESVKVMYLASGLFVFGIIFIAYFIGGR